MTGRVLSFGIGENTNLWLLGVETNRKVRIFYATKRAAYKHGKQLPNKADQFKRTRGAIG